MKVPVFWMFDPESDSIKSPFVRQPHYNDLENRIREMEAALKRIVLKDGRESIAVSKICDIARRALASSSEREAK